MPDLQTAFERTRRLGEFVDKHGAHALLERDWDPEFCISHGLQVDGRVTAAMLEEARKELGVAGFPGRT